MNEGNITVVDVIATDDGYQLSRPAQDLYIAYEVVRRHIDSDGVRHYAQMSSAKITDDGYEFKFETGDVFTCASHEDRPASATVSDAIAGGGSSGGGGDVVVSHITRDTVDGETVYTCDMTESEITAAIGDGKTVLAVFLGMISVWSDFLRVDYEIISVPTNTLRFIRFMYDQGSFINDTNAAYTLTPAT